MNTQPIQLFTIGFAGKSAERFFTILAEAKVRRVLDVRLYNSSQLAGYTKRGDLTFFLKSIIGADYSHLPGVAPTKDLLDGYHKGRVSWAEYEQQYRAILEHRRPQMPRQSFDEPQLRQADDVPLVQPLSPAAIGLLS